MEDGDIPESIDNSKLVRVRPVGMILNETVDWQEATRVVRDVDGGEPVAFVPFFE